LPLGEINRKLPGIKFVAVDPIANTAEGKKRFAEQQAEMEKYGSRYVQAMTPEQFYKDVQKGNLKVDGVTLAVPVKYHLPETERLLKELKVPIMVEKPLGLPGQVERFRELHRQNPGRIYAADFSNGTDSLNFAFEKGLFQKIGKVHTVVGRFVEKQELDELINAARDRKLLKLDVSGGGLGFDMGVHSLVTEGRILKEACGAGFEGMDLREVFLGAIDNPELAKHRDAEAETYWRNFCVLQNGIKVYNDAGKGLDTTQYLVQIKGEKGDLVISSGTGDTKPFVLLKKHNGSQPQLFVFPPGVGYRSIFENFILTALGRKDLVSPSADACMDTTSTSVEVVGKTYGAAHDGGQRIEAIDHGRTPILKNLSSPPGKLYDSSSVEPWVAV